MQTGVRVSEQNRKSEATAFLSAPSYRKLCIVAALVGGMVALTGCKVDDVTLPTGPVSASSFGSGSVGGSNSGSTTKQNGISSPTIISPLPGATFTDPQPNLTVSNASDDSGANLIYEFEVSTDDGFRTIASKSSTVEQGGGGLTFWKVEAALGDNQYFWRARARNATVAGPYSPISDFTVISGASDGSGGPPPPPGGPVPTGADVFDPLTGGGSVGEVSGGRFSSSGWQVTHRGNYIRYRIPPISSGFVQWENLGLQPFNPQRDAYSLLGMWDPSRGDYRENPFRVHVRKLDTNGHNPPYLRVRWISNGEQFDVGNDFLDWNPNQLYEWRLEWGGGRANLSLNGARMISINYSRSYSPSQHWVELGVAERAESILGVVYRNVQIGRR